MEGDLNRTLRLFEQMLDYVPEAVMHVDREGHVGYVNRAACEITGYSAKELIGASLTTLLDPRGAAAASAQLSRTLRTGIDVTGFKMRVGRKGKDTRIVSADMHPVIDGEQIVGAIGVFADLATRMRVERQYRLLESVLLHAREAIVITETDLIDPAQQRMLWVNPAFTMLTGYEAEEALGESLTILHGSETDRAVLDEIRDALLRRVEVQVELANYRKDGSTFWTSLTIVPIPEQEGNIARVVSFMVDVTDRRQREITLMRRLVEANRRLQEGPLAELFPGHGPATTYLRQQMLQAASSRSRLPILILGERGTGKAVVAREIHHLSPRAAGSFVEVDCTAIPAALFESEMFGHERGAFTGATGTKRGLFQQANGGTLFLDEIGELSLEQQAKLLTAIQERSIRRVGGTTTIPVDVRIMTATNRDLQQMRNQGRFREDLYDRLLGFPIEVPPLRDRGADLDLYVARFVARSAEEEGKTIVGVEPVVMDKFRRYPWPGNVRELEFLIQRMVAWAQEDRLTMDLVPAEIAGWQSPVTETPAQASAESGPAARRQLSQAEIEEVLRRNKGVLRRAALDLGVARSTLYRLLNKFGIRPD